MSVTMGFGALLWAVTGLAAAGNGMCIEYDSGLPSIGSIEHRISRRDDARFAGNPDRPIARSPEDERRINSFDEWLDLYLEVVLDHVRGDEQSFESRLQALEGSSGLDHGLEGGSILLSKALHLLKIYANANPGMDDLRRLSMYQRALQIVSVESQFELEPRDELAIARAQAKLGFVTGDARAIESALARIFRAEGQVNVAVDNAQEEHERMLYEAMARDMRINRASIHSLLGDLSGESERYREAIRILEAIGSNVREGCNNELSGDAAYQLGYAYLRLSRFVESSMDANELLAKALVHATEARRRLELFTHPSKWRSAHALSADIFGALASNAPSEGAQRDLRRLKERALLLSRSR